MNLKKSQTKLGVSLFSDPKQDKMHQLEPVSSQCFISIPPEKVGQPEVFRKYRDETPSWKGLKYNSVD